MNLENKGFDFVLAGGLKTDNESYLNRSVHMNKHHNKDCIAAEECNLDW
jgi:hypothetical protein